MSVMDWVGTVAAVWFTASILTAAGFHLWKRGVQRGER